MSRTKKAKRRELGRPDRSDAKIALVRDGKHPDTYNLKLDGEIVSGVAYDRHEAKELGRLVKHRNPRAS
jgi:hypothetical protein